jgi:hypothetical protein
MIDQIKTNKEIATDLKKILDTNGYKIGSKTARTVECSFLQGLICGNPEYSKNTYLVVCLMAGRSILDI